MDRKSLIVLAVAVSLLFAMSPIVDHFFPPKPVPVSPPGLTNQPPQNVPAPATGSNAAGPTAAAWSAPLVLPALPEETLTLTNEDLIFHFTSHGGGLKTVSLKKYPAIISRTSDTTAETNMAALNTHAPAPVLALLGNDAQGDNYFHLTPNGRVVSAEKTLANGLRLVKEFDIGSDYLFTARLRLENTSAQPLKIPAREVVVGTATPIGPLDDPTTLGTFWYNGIKAQNIKQPWFANRT